MRTARRLGFPLSLIGLVSVLLFACGGGSDDDPDAGPGPGGGCTEGPPAAAQAGYVHGVVRRAEDDAPLAGAAVRLVDVAGCVATDADGRFALPVAGGGAFHLRVTAADRTAGHRRGVVPAERDVAVDDVFLVALDPAVTEIGPEGGVHRSAAGGMELRVPAGALDRVVPVRATRFGAGRHLPGPLPETSHFTYAFEATVGGADLQAPVEVRLPNDRGFPPGTPVPVGVFDEASGAWLPEGMGAVSEDGAHIVYSAAHFSSYDCNYPTTVDDKPGAKKKDGRRGRDRCGRNRTAGNSVVDLRSGELRLDVEVPLGTARGLPRTFGLVYRSLAADPSVWIGGVAGEAPADLSGAPAYLRAEVQVEGVRAVAWRAAHPDSNFAGFLWDGVNARGQRLPTGVYTGALRLAWGLPGEYATAEVFGGAAQSPLGVMADEPVEAGVTVTEPLALFDGPSNPVAAGWFVRGVARVYVGPEGAVMVAEDGASRGVYLPAPRLTRRAGVGQTSFGCPTSGPATEGCLGRPVDVAAAPDGSLVVADAGEGRVLRVTAAGDYAPVYEGGEGFEPVAVAVAPDGTVFVADATSGVVSRVVGGALEPLAGGDPPTLPGLGAPVGISFPTDLAVMPDGRLLVADWPFGVRAVHPDGRVEDLSPDPLTHPDPPAPRHLALAADGSIYLSETNRQRVRRWWPDSGRLVTVLGQDGKAGFRGDGGPASDGLLSHPEGLALGADGTLYVADTWNARVRAVAPDGRLRTAAGWGHAADAGFDEGGPASDALLPSPVGLHLGADGVLVVADAETGRVLAVDPGDVVYDRPASNGDVLTRAEDGWRVARSDGEVEHFDADGRLRERVDALGRATTFAWEAERLVAITDDLGDAVTLRWGDAGLAAVVDPHGAETTFAVGADRDLRGVTYADGAETTYAYDDAHRVVGWTDADGRTATYAYGTHGRVAEVVNGEGHRRAYTPFETQALLNDLGEGGGPDDLAPAAPAPRSVWIDGAGQTWRVAYDSAGEAAEIERPDGVVVTLANHPAGMAATLTDDAGTTTRFYDAWGRLLATSGPEGEGELWYGDAAHPERPTRWTRPDGEHVQVEYDSEGRLATVQVGDDDARWTMTYAADGQIETLTDLAGRTRRHSYDARGNLVTLEGPAGVVAQLGYDARGNVVREDGPGGQTTYAYDALDRLVEVRDPTGAVHRFARDHQGLLTGVTSDGAPQTTLTRDGRGRLVGLSLAGAPAWTLAYDGEDRVTAVVNPAGGRVDATYDALDRVVGYTVRGGGRTETATLTWAGVDRLARAADEDSDVRWTYEEAGRLATVTQHHPGMAQPITLEYAVDAGRVSAVTYPALPGFEGGTFDLSYGAGGHLEQIYAPDGRSYDLPRDDGGRLEAFQIDWGDTLDVAYGHDAAGRVDSVVAYPDSWREQVAWRVACAYDVDDVRLSEDGPEGQVAYAYDGLRRLTGVTRSAGEDEQFAWDARGDPTGPDVTVDAHGRLTAVGDVGYAFDDAGRVIERTDGDGARLRFAWDADDKLVEVAHVPAGDDAADWTLEYRYDALGRLIARGVDGDLTFYVYDRDDLVLEVGTDGAVQALHLHGGDIDTPLATRRGADEVVYLRDPLGSVRALMRPGEAAPFATFAWSAFGRLLDQTGDATPRFGFHGAYRDADTGLVWLRLRWYDPVAGRFLSTDPLKFTTLSNPYAFPGLDPVGGRDPWGAGPPRAVKVAYAARQTYTEAKGFADAVRDPKNLAIKVGTDVAAKVATMVGGKDAGRAVDFAVKTAAGKGIGPGVDDVLKYAYDAWQAKDDCGRAKVGGQVFKDLLRGNKTFSKAVDDFLNLGNLVPGR